MASGAGAVGVTIEDLNLSFGRTAVLKGIGLHIEPGELFTFLGPSGSGKSTLLRAIAGFGPTPDGRILIGNDDVTHLPPWQRNVGMVFQSYALWPHMTVRSNVAFGLEERKAPAREIGDRVDRALDLVGLLSYADRRPSQLSGGQQQRVALARTIVVEPRVLLLDEPLSNLDANLRVEMRREILGLQRKLSLTTIFVTHDQEEANTISDRIAVLDEGLIQQVGSPMQLYDEPSNRFVADFLGTANLLDGDLREIEGKTMFVASEGLSFPVEGAAGRAVGGCTLMVRPQSLRIAAGRGPDAKGVISLRGDVEHSEFLGSVVRYSVRTAGRTLLVDQTHQSGQPAFGVGDTVVVSFEIRQTRVLGGT